MNNISIIDYIAYQLIKTYVVNEDDISWTNFINFRKELINLVNEDIIVIKCNSVLPNNINNVYKKIINLCLNSIGD